MSNLNLRGIALEKVTVTDRAGRDWPIHDGLPLRTALTMMELAPAWEEGVLSIEHLNKTVDGVLTVFKREDPSVTRDDILDAFDVDDLIQIILFLSTRVQQKLTPNETMTTDTTPTTTPRSTAKTARQKN